MLALVAGVGIVLAILYFGIKYPTNPNSAIPTSPRISTIKAIQIIQDDINKQTRRYLGYNQVSVRITDIAINRTKIAQNGLAYVSLEDFNKKNMKLPLVYINPNRTVFLVDESGYRSMGECYTGLSTYCGYLPPYNLHYQNRLLYGAELQVAETGKNKGPEVYAVDAINGEIVDSYWLRNDKVTNCISPKEGISNCYNVGP